MKELIRQYGGMAIAVLTCVLLIGLVANTRTKIAGALPQTTALTQQDGSAFDNCWRSQ